MKSIICFIKSLWRSGTSLQMYQGGHPIDGHDCIDIEEHDDCKVIVSKCKACGKVSIAWSKNNRI